MIFIVLLSFYHLICCRLCPGVNYCGIGPPLSPSLPPSFPTTSMFNSFWYPALIHLCQPTLLIECSPVCLQHVCPLFICAYFENPVFQGTSVETRAETYECWRVNAYDGIRSFLCNLIYGLSARSETTGYVRCIPVQLYCSTWISVVVS